MRRQEESHACSAAMRLFGIDMAADEVAKMANLAAGNRSSLTVMGAVGDFFRAINTAGGTRGQETEGLEGI